MIEKIPEWQLLAMGVVAFSLPFIIGLITN